MRMNGIDRLGTSSGWIQGSGRHDSWENTVIMCIDRATYRPQSTMDRPVQTKTKSVVLTVTEKRIVPFG